MNDPPGLADGKATLTDRVRALRLGDRVGQAKQSGRSVTWLPWLLCLLMAAAWVFLGSRWYTGEFSTPTSQEPIAGAPLTPEAATDSVSLTGSGDEVLSAKGYIVPAHRISISPIDISGRVVKLNFVEGQMVEKGHVLAEIDATSYRADLAEAEAMRDAVRARYDALIAGPRQAEVKRIEAELGEAKSKNEQARLQYLRSRATGGAFADREREEATYTYQATQDRVRQLEQAKVLLWPREETVAEAKADLEAAEARVTRSQFRYDNCRITAPVSGTILTKQAEEGNLINPVVGGISTSLCDMADLSDLEVELDIQERDIQKVYAGQACEIRADAFPTVRFRGYADRLMPIADRAKGVLPIRVKIIVAPNQRDLLKPEMGALVTFYDKKHSE